MSQPRRRGLVRVSSGLIGVTMQTSIPNHVDNLEKSLMFQGGSTVHALL